MSSFIPTTVIGVGTSGSKTVEWLGRLLYQEFRAEFPPTIRLIALDTAEEGTSRDDLTRSVTQQSIAVQDINSAWAELNRSSAKAEGWFSSDAMRRVQKQKTSEGAGGVRAIGRMCLWSNWKRTLLANSLDSREPSTAENRKRAAEILRIKLQASEVHSARPQQVTSADIYISDSEHHIYIIGSAAGGTASGSIRDIVHAVTNKKVGGIPPKIVVLLTLPPESISDKEGVGVNAAATLIDIVEMIDSPETIQHSVDRYPEGQLTGPLTQSPADAVYLLGPASPGQHGSQILFDCSASEEIQEGLAMIGAHWLYASLFGFGSQLSQRGADYQDDVEKAGDGRAYPPQKAHMRAFALGGAVRPVWLLSELVTRRLVELHAPRWIGTEGAALPHSLALEWTLKGKSWLDVEVDNQLRRLSASVLDSLRKREASAEVGGVEPGSTSVEQILSTLRALHTTISGSASANAVELSGMLDGETRAMADGGWSLLAAEKFLEGASEALAERLRRWTEAGVDCVRATTPDGWERLLSQKGEEFSGFPPAWMGGAGRAARLEEARTELADWMAACYLAPLLFGVAEKTNATSLKRTVKELGVAVDRRKGNVAKLREKWTHRENTITRIDQLARGTISLVWFEPKDRPEDAADRVLNQLIAHREVDAQLRSGLGSLWDFLDRPTHDQVQSLLENWTSQLVIAHTAEAVRASPLQKSGVASEDPKLLLALNPHAASRKYFAPMLRGDLGAPRARYHLTQGEAASGWTTAERQSRMCENMDLKYVEAFGFTLFDLDPFREWLPRLLRAENVLAERDPYGGIGRYVDRLSSVLAAFVRDLLITWDVANGTASVGGVWEDLKTGAGAFLHVDSNAGSSKAMLDLGTAQRIPVELDLIAVQKVLRENPKSIAELMERIRKGLALSDRSRLKARWDNVRQHLHVLHGSSQIDLERVQFDYGIDSKVGTLGHLIND